MNVQLLYERVWDAGTMFFEGFFCRIMQELEGCSSRWGSRPKNRECCDLECQKCGGGGGGLVALAVDDAPQRTWVDGRIGFLAE